MLPFSKFFEGWTNDRSLAQDAVLPHSDIGQVPTNHALTHDDILAIQNYVLRTTEGRLPAYFIACVL